MADHKILSYFLLMILDGWTSVARVARITKHRTLTNLLLKESGSLMHMPHALSAHQRGHQFLQENIPPDSCSQTGCHRADGSHLQK
jgi:hypothetical protein